MCRTMTIAATVILTWCSVSYCQVDPDQAPGPAPPPVPNLAPPAAPPVFALSDRDTSRLDKLASYLAAGRLGSVHELAQPLVESRTPDEIEQASRYLAIKGINESLPELLLNARLQMVFENQGKRIRRPGEKELSLALPFLSEQAAKLLQAAETEGNTGLPVALPHEIVDERLEVIPKLLTQVEQARAIYEHLYQLCRRLQPADLGNMDAATQGLATRKWRDQATMLTATEDKLVERIVELSIMQLRDMVVVLGNRSVNYNDRFLAVRRIRTALSLLDKYKKPFETRKTRNPALADPRELYSEAEQIARTFRRIAGEFERKAFLLEEGTRWWIRGRFGLGPLDGGLAKAIPNGVRNLQDFLLYYPLRLPNPIPHPPDPTKNPLNEPVSRRHIAYWLAESGVPTLARWPADFVIDRADPNWPKEVLGQRDYQQLVSKLDFNLASVGYVGYLEYQMALLYFEELLRHCNEAEAQAIDAMIAEDDRLAVHSNISRQYDAFAQDSSLKYPFAKTTDPRAKGDYERRGLRWMMALARLELGAMVAARIPPLRRTIVTRRPLANRLPPGARRVNGINLERVDIPPGTVGQIGLDYEEFASSPGDPGLLPFSIWPPTPFESEAFQELLWDATRQHYYSLRTEFLFSNQGRANAALLSRVLIRFAVAAEIANAAETVSRSSLSTDQRKELDFWQSWMEHTRTLVEQTMMPTTFLMDARGRWPVNAPWGFRPQ